MSGWIVAAWLVGALGIVLAGAKLSRGELISLAFWPITVPAFMGLRIWRHWRYTCPEHGYFGDRERYARHLALSHARVPDVVRLALRAYVADPTATIVALTQIRGGGVR